MALELTAADREKFLAARNLYDLKIATIRNSIFACDIEPSAVDIAKLRLWLSIVIDDAPSADKNSFRPKPLPNLDCNIICGNSLLDEFGGVPLIKHSKFLGNLADDHGQGSVFQELTDDRIKELIQRQKVLFSETNHANKEELRQRIRDIYDEIVIEQLGKNSALAKKYKSLPFILWQLYFPTVFKDNGGFDVIIGNPPYGAKISAADKKTFKKIYRCTKTISGIQKGSTDTFALFIEKSFDLCNRGGLVNLIVPMSVTSSDAMTALHDLLEANCNVIRIASFSDHPKKIFATAYAKTSIISLKKTLTPLEKIFTTKVMRRSTENTLAKIMSSLTFVESSRFKLPGRYPKIGDELQRGILGKMFSFGKKIADYSDTDGNPFYYRTSGGRYFNIITNYPTGSSKEKPYYVASKFTKIIAATLSTNLFWFYQQVYTNGLDLKIFEIETVPLFDLESLATAQIDSVEKIYDEYLSDIERNITRSNFAKGSVYQKSGAKIYKLVRSKPLIDALDDLIGTFYGLTAEEINFVKTFELAIRMSGADYD